MTDNITGEVTLTADEAAAREKYLVQVSSPNADHANTNEGDDDKPQRPEHIPEKFWDVEKGEVRVEDLAKSYVELEKARAAKSAVATPGEDIPSTAADDTPDPLATTAAEIATHREAITAKLVAGQALEDADYKPFEKVGFSREDIDAFIDGQAARGELQAMEVHAEVGGGDAYKAMVGWARTSLSKEEVAVYDKDIYSADKAVRLNAARGLAARYAQANGTPGVSVTNKTSGGGTDSGYASKAEMVKDMSDERYSKDSAFREQVSRRVAAAMRNGVVLR